MLIDTHTHLMMRELGRDPAGAVSRARKAGVEQMISIGIDRENSRATATLAERLDGVWAAVGIHPNEPAYVAHTARRLAEVWDEPFEEVAARTTANARGFFGLA